MWRRLRAFFSPVVYQRGPRLTDAQVVTALAAEVDGLPTFEAVLQLIDDLEATCGQTAIGMVGDHGVLASEVGGMQTLGELRATMLRLRQVGRRDEDDEE